MPKHKIYCFNNGGADEWYSAIAMADDGHVLAQHICSDESFMPHDLGITSDWKHEQYDAHFGKDNWELVWVPTNEVKTHPGLCEAYNLNQQLAATKNA